MKTLTTLALALVAISSTASAQTLTNTAQATVTATVVVPVTITNEQGLDFGNDLERNVFKTVSVNSPEAARFYIQGDAGDNVAFTIDPTVTLYLDGPGTQTQAGVNAVDGQTTTMTMIPHGKINTINDFTTLGGAEEILPAPDDLSTPGVNDGGAHPVGSGI